MQAGEEKNIFKKRLFWGAVIYAILFLLIITTANINTINAWLMRLILILRPVLIGLAIAYLCNPFFRFFERKAFPKLHPSSLRRAISLLCTYLTVLLIIVLLLALILPQLVSSVGDLVKNYDLYLESAIKQFNRGIDWINSFAERLTQNPQMIPHVNLSALSGKFLNWLKNVDMKDIMLSGNTIAPITNTLSSALSVVTDTIFGLFISIYLLSTKEKRYRQVMKLRNALFNDKINGRITRFCQIADRSFGKFLEGKAIDSFIIGVLTYILISIFDIPYAILIATFVGITNIIPIIGPLIGAIPTAFIILLADSSKVIPFLIIIIIVQQIDGNIIGPKILGNNTGVSPLCVIIAIATMTSLWGLLGALLGVPLFATVLELSDFYITERLQRKGLPAGVESYYPAGTEADPVKDMRSTTNKTIHRLEKRILSIRKKRVNDETAPLTRSDRFCVRLYELAQRFRIVSDISDETHWQFAAEEAEKQALADSDRAMDESDKQHTQEAHASHS